MREYTIGSEDAGKRLDKWMLANVPKLSPGLAQKSIRLKKVRLNGVHPEAGARLNEGDTVRLFLSDELFEEQKREDPFLTGFRTHLHILYEDENLLLADKKPGVMCHPDDTERINTLLTHVQAYLYQKGEYDSKEKGAFAPALCNRIDRFTGGIVIAAKNEESLKIMNRMIADRQVRKFYLCALHGALNPGEGVLRGYIRKPEGSRSVQVLRTEAPGAQEALTGYRTLAANRGLTLVECELFTGRTHQIRAQMADAGHPLLGDTQYGSARLDAGFERGYQALYAYRVDFSFEGDAGRLAYLRGKSFRVGRVAFADESFPGFRLGQTDETRPRDGAAAPPDKPE